MQIRIGARVQTRDGQEVGTIDRLILDPATNAVKAAVIRRGVLLPRDVAIPVTAVETGPAGDLRLAYTADQLDGLPDFVESDYTATPPVGSVAPIGAAPAGLLWPTGYGVLATGPLSSTALVLEDEAEEMVTPTQQDLANALIDEGSDIVSRDGKVVGQLASLAFDPASGHLTRFVIRRGLVFARTMELPAALIARSDDRALSLRVDATTIDAWLRLTEGLEVWTRDGVLLGAIARRTIGALEVVDRDRTRWLRVPLGAVASVEDGVVRLAADAAQASRWQAPPSQEPPADQTVPVL